MAGEGTGARRELGLCLSPSRRLRKAFDTKERFDLNAEWFDESSLHPYQETCAGKYLSCQTWPFNENARLPQAITTLPPD